MFRTVYFTTNRKWPFWLFWIICSVIYAAVFTTIDFCDNPFSGIKGFMTLAMQYGVVAFSVSGVICLIAVNRYVFVLSFPVLIVLSSVLAYYRITMGVYISPAVIELMRVNNMAMWGTVMSFKLVLTVLAALLFSLAVVLYRFKYVVIERSWMWLLLGIIIILIPTHLIGSFRSPVTARMPYCFYYSLMDYISYNHDVSKERDTFINVPVAASQNAPDVVLVIGESLRSDHLSLNGYERLTTPRLQKDTAVVAYPFVTTEPCYTHTSVPHIVTRADSIHPDRKWEEQSFITLFKKAGFKTFWISNQDDASTYVYFMNEADTLQRANVNMSMYNFGNKNLDLDILPLVKNDLRDKNSKSKLFVIHSIGSHWYYNTHYPDSLAIYKPEVNSRVLSDLSQEQLINSYDNTILATDDFLSKLIDLFRKRNAILIYISDHGESLGEEGRFLHAVDAPELHKPACFIWYSDKYALNYPEKICALKDNARKKWSSDIIFHTVLDAGTLSTDVFEPSLSVLVRH